MKKSSYKVLWNVFLFVICGGSLIYGYVQQRRMVETRVETEKCQQQVDSLKIVLKEMNEHLKIAQKQFQIEKKAALSASNNNQ